MHGGTQLSSVLLQVLLWPLDIINHPRSAIELWIVTPSSFGTDHWTLAWPSDFRVPSSFGILYDIFKLTITYISYCVTFCWQSNSNPSMSSLVFSHQILLVLENIATFAYPPSLLFPVSVAWKALCSCLTLLDG